MNKGMRLKGIKGGRGHVERELVREIFRPSGNKGRFEVLMEQLAPRGGLQLLALIDPAQLGGVMFTGNKNADEVYYSNREIRRAGDFVAYQYNNGTVAKLDAKCAYMIVYDTNGALSGRNVEAWLLTDGKIYCDLGFLSLTDAEQLAHILGISIRSGKFTGQFPACIE